jgi:hypothetical protein
MAFDFTISGNSLVVTNETDSKIVFDAPKRDHYFVNDKLNNGTIDVYDTNGDNQARAIKFSCPISQAKIEGVSATESLARTFQGDNLGKAEAGGASNHSELVLDDGTNPHGTTKSDIGLSNVPNTDFTSSVSLNTLKVSDVNHVDIQLPNVDNTSDALKPISTATQTALDGKKDDFAENSAFNKDFGTTAGTVLEGDAAVLFCLKSVYDPTNVNADAFDYENAIGITQITGTELSETLTWNTHNFNPTGFDTCNYLRLDMSSDRELTGFIAPAAGIDRIIRGVNVSDKKIKFQNNDSGSTAANRLLLKEYANKDCKKGEAFAFKYDHISNRWRPLVRIG